MISLLTRFLTVSLLSVSAAFAQTDGTWSATGALTGSTSWQTTTNWSDGTVAGGVGATATIQRDFTGTITLTTTGHTIGTLNLSDTGTGTDRTFVLGSGTWTFATASGTPTVNIGQAGDTLAIGFQMNAATLSGSQGLTLAVNPGVMYAFPSSGNRIGGSVTYTGFTGALTLSGGRWTTENPNVLPAANELVLTNGAVLRAVGVNGTASVTRDQTIGGLSSTDSTTNLSSGDNASVNGTLTLNTAADATFSYAGQIGADAFNLGSGLGNTRLAITKNGAGTQKFSGAATYVGTTTINAGTLIVNGTHTADTSVAGNLATLTSRGLYIVNSGGTLGGNGSLRPYNTSGGAVMIELKSGGTLAPGDPAVASGVGTLTLDQTNSAASVLFFNSGATLALDLGGAANDKIALVGSSAVANEVFFNTTGLTFNDVTGGALASGQYVLFAGDADTAYSGLTTDSSGIITAGLTIAGGLERYAGSTLQLVGNTIVLNLVAPAGEAPPAPTGLTSGGSYGAVSLSWNAVSGAASYQVKRSTSATGPFTTIASVAEPAYVDASGVSGLTYYYLVTAVGGGGESVASTPTEAIPFQAVGLSIDFKSTAETGLALSDLAGAVRLANWNGFNAPSAANTTTSAALFAAQNGGFVSGFGVSFTSGSGGPALTVASAESGNDVTMMRSIYDIYNGTPSTITLTGIPYATYDILVYVWDDGSARAGSVTLGGTTYYVRGGAGIPNNAGSGYVLSTDTSLGAGTDIAQGNYVRFTGLTGSTATLSLAAVNGGDSVQRLKVAGLQIIASGVQTPVSTAPATPDSVTVVGGTNVATLYWNPTNTASSYSILRATSEGGPATTIATVGGASGTYRDTSAAANVTYFYTVVATNAAGSSAASSPVNVTLTDPATIDAFAINLRAYNTYGMAVSDLAGAFRLGYWNNLVGPVVAGEAVSTTQLTNHLGRPLTGVTATFTAGTTTTGNYTNSGTLKLGPDRVTVDPLAHDENLFSSVFEQYDGTPASLTITGIPYATYDLLVYVYDNGATRGGVITANGQTLALRGGVGNPTATGTGYVRSTDSTHTTGTAVQQANYVRFTGLSGDLNATFLATNVGSSTQRLRLAGFQIVSNSAVAAPTAVPAAPAAFTASAGDRQVALNWAHTATATSYKLYRDGSLLATVASPLVSYADTTVSNGTAYAYTVSALNGVGEGPATSPASATPADPAFTATAQAVYQYSVPLTPAFGSWTPDPQRRAYLWVPPGVTKLQGVLFGLHNMLEKPLFEDPVIRQACADAKLGIVFISPGDSKTWSPNGAGNYVAGAPTTALDLDPNSYASADINPATGTAYSTDINPATGTRFSSQSEQAGAEVAALLNTLAAESGYSELVHAPVLLVGHSAASTFLWTRSVHTSSALANRVIAIVPYKGSFPSSVPDNLPILHVASEWQEISSWGNTWELGDANGVRPLRAGGTRRLVGEFVQPGTGHYHYSFEQSGPIATFIKQVTAARVPTAWPADSQPTLTTLEPETGYLVDVTRLGSGQSQPVAYADWIAAGKDPLRAYWYPDLATAQAICDVQNAEFAKLPQVINAFKDAATPATLASQNNGAGTVTLTPALLDDGASFTVRGASLNQSPVQRLFHAGPLGIPTGSIRYEANFSGAMKQTGPTTFRVWLDRGSLIKSGQPWEPFIIARHPGDANYREADRPIWINTAVPVTNTTGTAQTITFPAIPNQVATALQPLTLEASASSGLPVQYWMVGGPYVSSGITLPNATLTPQTLPARASFPFRVTVGSFQWGTRAGTQFASATPTFQTFWIFADAYQKLQYETYGVLNGASSGAGNVQPTWTAPATSTSPTADLDGDGYPNLLEYALTGNLSDLSSTTLPEASTNLDGYLQLSFPRIADPALTYTVEASSDLTTWSDIWHSTGGENIAGMITVQDTVKLDSTGRRFLRVKVAK